MLNYQRVRQKKQAKDWTYDRYHGSILRIRGMSHQVGFMDIISSRTIGSYGRSMIFMELIKWDQMGVSMNGYSQNGWFIMENPNLKWMI